MINGFATVSVAKSLDKHNSGMGKVPVKKLPTQFTTRAGGAAEAAEIEIFTR